MTFDDVTNRRCRRTGRGDPAMCDEHRALVGSPTPLGQLFDAFIGGRPPSPNVVKDAMIQAAEGLLGRKLTAAELRQAAAGGGFSWRGVFGGSSSSSSSSDSSQAGPDANARRAHEAAELEKARAIGRARRTLGFSAKDEITPTVLKARHRELVKKWHPDRFASDPAKHKVATTRMMEINAAVDLLSNPL